MAVARRQRERARARSTEDATSASDVGELTLDDILAELEKPGRDPRATFEPPKFRDDVRTLEDLKPGMELEGVVTNVTAFGAFVDVGVHQDGLVHVSQLADQFVKDPSEVVKVGDKLACACSRSTSSASASRCRRGKTTRQGPRPVRKLRKLRKLRKREAERRVGPEPRTAKPPPEATPLRKNKKRLPITRSPSFCANNH